MAVTKEGQLSTNSLMAPPYQQARRPYTAINPSYRNRRFHHSLAVTAGILRTDMAVHDGAGRFHIQLLADIINDLNHTAAPRAA